MRESEALQKVLEFYRHHHGTDEAMIAVSNVLFRLEEDEDDEDEMNEDLELEPDPVPKPILEVDRLKALIDSLPDAERQYVLQQVMEMRRNK